MQGSCRATRGRLRPHRKREVDHDREQGHRGDRRNRRSGRRTGQGDPGRSDGGFTLRALTRNPQSEAARQFADQGAEVVEADIRDETSLAKAFDGAYGAYVVTNFW